MQTIDEKPLQKTLLLPFQKSGSYEEVFDAISITRHEVKISGHDDCR